MVYIRKLSYPLIFTILLSTASLLVAETAGSYSWKHFLSGDDSNLAASKEGPNGLLILVYAPNEKLFNLVFLPRHAQTGNPVTGFLSATLIGDDGERPLDFSGLCNKQGNKCHDHQQIRIQLSTDDLSAIGQSRQLQLRYLGRQGAVENARMELDIPFGNVREVIENLIATGAYLKSGN